MIHPDNFRTWGNSNLRGAKLHARHDNCILTSDGSACLDDNTALHIRGMDSAEVGDGGILWKCIAEGTIRANITTVKKWPIDRFRSAIIVIGSGRITSINYQSEQ